MKLKLARISPGLLLSFGHSIFVFTRLIWSGIIVNVEAYTRYFRSSNCFNGYGVDGWSNLFIWFSKFNCIDRFVESPESSHPQIYYVEAGFCDFCRNCNFDIDILHGDFLHFFRFGFFARVSPSSGCFFSGALGRLALVSEFHEKDGKMYLKYA